MKVTYRMQLVLKVAIVLGVISEIHSSGDYYDYTFDNYEKLEIYRQGINKWYGESSAKQELWDLLSQQPNDTTCHLDYAWVLDDSRKTLLAKENNEINADQKQIIIETLEALIDEEVNKSVDTGAPHCRELFDELSKYRSHIDCALNRRVVTNYFTNMFPPTDCWEFAEDIWKTIVRAGQFDQKCSSIDVYNDLVRIAQISKKRYIEPGWNSKGEVELLYVMARLTETVSSPEHLKYLNRIACPDQPDTEICDTIVEQVYPSVCGPIDMKEVKKIETLIKKGSVSNPISTADDMLVMMEIMKDLTEIVEMMSKMKEMERSVQFAIGTLDTYLDIIDNTIGENAKDIWTELPLDESSERLQFVLENNEKYIGAMSDILLGTDEVKSPKINKHNRDTMALQMIKVDKKKHRSTDKIGFEFGDAEIETVFGENVNMSENTYKVYAIHYKSWADLMGKTGISDNTSTGNTEKNFVGNGGIISLSARDDEGKQSLPVVYKMKFGDKFGLEGNSSTTQHRCLSCEFLNMTTGKWMDTGCVVGNVNENGVTCNCSHTTNFAAFMSPIPIEINMTDAQYQAKQIVSYVGSGISVVALAASLVIFNFVRSTIKNDRLKAHINLAIALFFVHATQLIVDFAANNDVACLTTAVITHFFLLASFFWMLIEGIFLYLYVVQVFVHSSIEYIRWLFVLGWIVPAVIVAISAGIGIPNDTYLDLKDSLCGESQVLYPPLPGSKYEECWLSAKTGMAWSFIAPALIIILINMVILGKVVQVLVQVSARSNIRPIQPPMSSTSSVSKSKSSSSSSGFVNRSYGKKDSEAQTKYKTTSETKSSKLNDPGIESVDTGYGSTTNGVSKPSEQSPSRFDNRIPSQAYMHNKALAANHSPSKDESGSGKNFLKEAKAAVKGALVLLPILGIPWICGMWVGNNYALMMLFIVINSTQGLVIFIVYCLLNGEVRRAMQRHLRLAKIRSESGRTRSSSTSSLRSLNSKFTWRRKASAPESRTNK